jgi:hypothetical protein
MHELQNAANPCKNAIHCCCFFGGVTFAVILWALWATLGIRFFLWFWTDSWSLDSAPASGKLGTASVPNVAASASGTSTGRELGVAQLGQVGDLFSGVNALFAAFAFLKHVPEGPSIDRAIVDAFCSPLATMQSTDRAKYWMYKPQEHPNWAVGVSI